MPHTKKQGCIAKWFRKAFKSTFGPEYGHITRQTDIEGAVWTTSSTKYHPSGYYEPAADNRIPYYGPVSRPKPPFPRSYTESSHAYSRVTYTTAPNVPRLPTITHHDTLTGTFVHKHKDSSPTSSASGRTPCASPKPKRNNTQKPPHTTYFDYLSNINHTFPQPQSSSHAYGHQAKTAPLRPATPFRHPINTKKTILNTNKALPDIPYHNPKPKYPHAHTNHSHAYEACTPGPITTPSRTREQARARALAQLCSAPDPHTPPSSHTDIDTSVATESADWERDWDVPLSQRTGNGKVLHQTEGNAIQIRNRESVVALMGREQRRDEGAVLRGELRREGKGRVEFVGVEEGEEEGENPFEEEGGEDTEESDKEGEGEDGGRLERMSEKRYGKAVWQPA
ncbi:hypothetical protein T440DRAFT_540836 [Plenodomus tracheiphilus IPT5]|uniref:Pal1-domain-containing protein n=1 Tax=Plenodomus tracheiphilus IPT5 TaxID=1408161 RepID=A0A6A7ATX1_9PLEO|nr:hypothetical protein T440DRAFT_540836 [Plenodomus tracheiphilus IPT5]